MAQTLVALGALFCVAFADIANWNQVDGNWAVDEFSGAAFPFAMGTCNPNSLVPTQYWIYQCVNTTTAKKHKYTKSDCRPTSWAGSETIYKDPNQTYPTTGFIYCGGCDGFFAKVSFVANECANAKATLHATLNGCADLGDHNKSLTIWCNRTHAEMQYVGDAVCSDRNTYLYSYFADRQCSHMFDFTSKSQQEPVPIVAQTTDCYLGSDESTWQEWTETQIYEGDEYKHEELWLTSTEHSFVKGGFCHSLRPTYAPTPPTPSPTGQPTPKQTSSSGSGSGGDDNADDNDSVGMRAPQAGVVAAVVAFGMWQQ